MTVNGLAACEQNGAETGSRPAAGSLSPQDAAAAVREFDPADLESSVARLNQVFLEGSGDIVSALAPFLEDPDPVQRWASVYLAALMTDTVEEANQAECYGVGFRA